MNNVDIDLFCTIVREGNFSRASRASYMDYTSLVRRVDAMESQLGVRLFNRTTHGVTLTPAGEVFWKGADQLRTEFKDLMAAVRDSQTTYRPRLTVGVTPRIMPSELTAMWEILKKKYPGYVLKLRPYSDIEKEQLRMYEELGFQYDYLACLNVRKGIPSQYYFLPLFEEELAAGVPSSLPLADRARLHPADLAGRRLLLPDPANYPGISNYVAWMKKHIPKLELVYEPEAGEDMINRAVYERTPVLIPRSWEDIHPELTAVPLVDFGSGPMTVPFGFLYNEQADASRQKTA